ncbi:MAG: O-antigen ligase family protein [Bacteroidia bacterium]
MKIGSLGSLPAVFLSPFVVGLIILPFIYDAGLMDPVLLPRFLFLNLLIIATFFILLASKSRTFFSQVFTENRWLWPYGLFLLIAGFSIFFSINPADGFFEWATATLFFSFYLLLATFRPADQWLLKVIAVFSAMALASGIIQFFTLSQNFRLSHQNTYLIASFFGHRNIFAESLLLLFPLLIRGVIELQKGFRILTMIMAALSLVFMVILLNRTVWVGLSCAGLLTAILYFTGSKKQANPLLNRKILLISSGIFALIIALTLGFYAASDSTDTIFKQITSIADPRHNSTTDRIGLWQRSLTLFLEKPIAGHGMGSWKSEVLRLGTLGLKSANEGLNFVRPHNDFLWILSETGAIGLLAYGFFFAMAGYALFRKLKSHTDNSVSALAALFGLTAYIIIACFSFPKERPEHSIFLAITLLPLTRAGLDSADVFSKKSHLISFLLIVPLLVISLSGMYIGYFRYMGEKHIFRAIEWENKQQWDRALKELAQVNLRYLPLDHTGTPVQLYTGSIYMMKFQPKYGCSEYQRAYHIHPYNPEVIAGLAQCYKLSGQTEEAEAWFKKSLEIAPYNNQTLLRLTFFYLENGRDKEAVSTLRKVDPQRKDPRYDEAIAKVLEIEFSEINSNPQYAQLSTWLADSTLEKPNFNHIFRESIFTQQTFSAQLTHHAGISRP